MYVCICRAVTEQQIKTAVANGIHSVKALRQSLGVAGQCGKCSETAKECILKELNSKTSQF